MLRIDKMMLAKYFRFEDLCICISSFEEKKEIKMPKKNISIMLLITTSSCAFQMDHYFLSRFKVVDVILTFYIIMYVFTDS